MSTTTVNDSNEDMPVVESSLTENFNGCADAAMNNGQILWSELFSAELTLV